jgi:asparagine synthase (glutamine-hydrolysing)
MRLRLFGELAGAGDQREVYRELVSVWRTGDLARLVPSLWAEDRFCPGFEHAGSGRVERMMRCDARTYLIDDILQKVDRTSMAVSLEARTPLLDPEVVAMAMRSSGDAEKSPGAKPLLRRTLKLRLPAELVDRPKKGFGAPVGEWMRGDLRPLLEDLVMSRESEYYASATARDVCHAHLAGAPDLAPRVWSLLMFELWRDRWFNSRG